jgi:general L-amino acid transport system permease protein
MAVSESAAPVVAKPSVSILNDQKVRGQIFQVILVVALVWFGWSLIANTAANLKVQGTPFGFEILKDTAGFSINQTLIEYSETSSYGDVYWVGLLNTLLIAGVGIVFATLLGFLIGVARLSSNWVISRVAYVYIEALRNIPLLLQIFIWYFGVLRLLPAKREAADLGVFGFLNVAGLFLPKPIMEAGSAWIGYAFIFGIIASVVVRSWARKRQFETGQQFPIFWTSVGLIVGLPLLVYILAGFPISLEYPKIGNFGPRGGLTVLPEFIALLLALSMYTASFIAEIVRAGILAVSKGQTEAAHSLGLRPGPTLQLVVIPQAMRVIIPPLTSQYLNLAKNSSLAVAIAYPDLVSVFAGTALNQSGRAVEFILITMLTYLTISLLTSTFMNWYNRRMALVER